MSSASSSSTPRTARPSAFMATSKVATASARRRSVVGDVPEGVAVEGVVVVLGGRDGEEPAERGDVFQGGELRPDALAVSALNENRGFSGSSPPGRGPGHVGDERADPVVRLAEADDQLGPPPSASRIGQPFDLALRDRPSGETPAAFSA